MKKLLNKFLQPFNLEIHGKGYLQALAKGDFNQDAFQVQKELLKEKQVKVIFDCGANRGDVLLKYLDIFPDATVHCFEPFPASFEQLSAKFSSNERVILNMAAISDQKQNASLFINSNVDTNSLHEPIQSGLSSDKQVKNISQLDVSCITIDDYCTEKNIKSIDILKMDIQGGEYNALRGAKSLLEKKRINLIFTETYFVRQYADQPLFYEIGKYLLTKDYNLQDMYNPIYGKGNLAWCDAIFLPNFANI